MATVTEVKGFPAVEAGADVLGEIVSWDLTGVEVRYSHLVDALRDAGLDPKVARAMLPRNAFTRAARKLTDQRIIRKVNEDESVIRFQLTRETRAGDELVYQRDAVIALDKATGAITADDPDLGRRARDLFDEAMDRRTASDVTSIVQRLFSDKAAPGRDLVPIRKQGGAYFVRRSESEFLDKVGAFLDRLHGDFMRLPIAAGRGTGEKVIRESVAEKIAGLIRELDGRVSEFDPDPGKQSQVAIKNAAERVKLIRYKIESYQEYLSSERDNLSAALTQANLHLRAKVFGVSAAEMADGAGA